MNNLKLNILISAVTFILCVIITVTSGINFFWIIVPIIIIGLVAVLSSLMKQRFGSTYGIAGYMVILFVIPTLWYIFSSNMPITSKTIESQKKVEDLSSFQKYSGSVDAKKEVAQYQMKQDELLKEQVTALLNLGKVDSALSLIKQNESSSERIKKELFSSITNTTTTTQNTPSQPSSSPPPTQQNTYTNQNSYTHSASNTTICGEYPEGSQKYLTTSDLKGKSKEQLRIMRNEIYMRHGYIFKSPDLATKFSVYSCYKAQNSDVTHLLTPLEKLNVELIKKEEYAK